MDESDDSVGRSADEEAPDLTGEELPDPTDEGATPDPVEASARSELPPRPETAGNGDVDAPDSSVLDKYEPPVDPDDAEPIPAPDEEIIPESEQVRRAVSADLQEAFENGAGPFDQPPTPEFLEESWFDFSYLDRYDEVSRSWVDKPYAYVSVLYDPEIDEYRYHITDPELDEFERYVRNDLEGIVRDVLMYEEVDPDRPDREVVSDSITDILVEYAERVDRGSLTKVYYHLLRDFVGTGKIDPIMRDPAIEDISCVGENVPVFVYHQNYRDLRSNLVFDRDRLSAFVSQMAARAGKHISVANPMLDATMPDGSRVQLTLGSEVSTRGSNFTVRKFADIPHTPIDLINWNTYPLDALAFLWLAVQNDMSMLFAGGTASGKTTSMNATSFFIPPNSKVVSIEDTREITLPHDNWIQSVSRRSFGGEGSGDIDTSDLLQSGLRQRPEYLLVGEIRTEQEVALTFFQAIATGHTGYSTFHADSVESVIDRLENPPLNVPGQMLRSLDLVAVQKQQFVGDRRVRRLTELTELVRDSDSGFDAHTLFSWDPADDSFEFHGNSRVRERIKRARGWNDDEFDRQLDARRVVLGYLVDNDITDYHAVTDAIHSFARRPDAVLEAVREGTFRPGE